MKLMAQINRLLPYLKKPSDMNTFNNVLVVSNSGLGDTILSTPSIVSLRKSFPDINITFMLNKKMFPLFDGFEFVDSFVLYSSGFFSQLRIIKKLRKRRIDTIFLFHANGPEDVFFSILSGAKNILKTTNNTSHEFQHIFSNPPNSKLQHNIESKLDLARLFHAKIIVKEMFLNRAFYGQGGMIVNKKSNCRYIGIQLGAQDKYKMWPVENFAQLSKKILDKYKNIFFVLIGATDYEQELSNNYLRLISNFPDKVFDFTKKTKINELPFLINDLDLLITNDTGVLHLAITLKRKTISLFGPTDSEEFGPYQDLDLHKVIQVDGSFVNNVPKKKRSQKGIKLISVNCVYKVADSVLKSL